MLRLTLLRHAKSSWDDPELSDHERQLTKRGTKAARRMGRFIAKHELTPDLILCSDAIRTRATLALVIASFVRPLPPARILAELYLATPDAIVAALIREAGEVKHVLIIGHNPGVHALALSLPGEGTKADLKSLAMKFPTGALADITFDLDEWSLLEPTSGRLERFVTPHDLASTD